MRPKLRTGVPVLWRTDDLLQFGTDPTRAAAIPCTLTEQSWLLSLDGSRTRGDAVAAGANQGLSPGRGEQLLTLLQQVGALEDAGVNVPELGRATPDERTRLAPDIAAAGLALGTPGAGAINMSARRQAVVEVRGTGRGAAATIGLLAAAGIGRLTVSSQPTCAEISPFTAGLGATATMRAVVERCSPSTVVQEISSRVSAHPPHVVVLADRQHQQAQDTEALVAADVPHLLVHAVGHRIAVGPLVVPGVTACLRCIYLSRRDRDPTWSRQSAQLTHRTDEGPVDTVLATLAGALAARRVLGVIEHDRSDGAGFPGAGTCLEYEMLTQEFSTRTWLPHPICGCTWPG